MAWVRKYFGPLPKRATPVQPDITEPRQDKEKRATKPDPLATRPALAASWHMPARNTPEYYAMGLIDQVLVQGKDSRLYRSLVQDKGLTGDVQGGINLLGNMFNIAVRRRSTSTSSTTGTRRPTRSSPRWTPRCARCRTRRWTRPRWTGRG
jgi:predicted Zn-dependent peptidase